MTLYDDHERIAFPLLGTDDHGIPHDLLVDCLVHAPASYGAELTLISLSSTSLGIASLVLAIDGVAAAYCTVADPDVHEPIPLQAIRPGVSGFVAFGYGVDRHMLRIDGSYPLESRCLIAYPDHLATATVKVGGHELTGLVRLDGGPGLSIRGVTMKVKLEDTSIVEQVVGLIGPVDPVGADPIPGCMRPAEGAAAVEPITRINGVIPSCAGEITLQVVNVRETPDQPGLQPVVAPGKIVWKDEGEPCGS